ncbi:hypothetical protein PPERSA_07236 [Pseudocohnilembus persalinus]|uniref:Transmembrane protein n=1 Tax=Pseudocohnilembus persalinus TaxID=266149 RepID=A0A0V0QCU3_PSEPJ|nr:hypothetical protein PPERSA_07236 [Pseudocohnilembus persalinus]|eukprot:KRX00039.1 hypothetical protein PPERSA_07236 [Pseudocohnilembus persalinus]
MPVQNNLQEEKKATSAVNSVLVFIVAFIGGILVKKLQRHYDLIHLICATLIIAFLAIFTSNLIYNYQKQNYQNEPQSLIQEKTGLIYPGMLIGIAYCLFDNFTKLKYNILYIIINVTILTYVLSTALNSNSLLSSIVIITGQIYRNYQKQLNNRIDFMNFVNHKAEYQNFQNIIKQQQGIQFMQQKYIYKEKLIKKIFIQDSVISQFNKNSITKINNQNPNTSTITISSSAQIQNDQIDHFCHLFFSQAQLQTSKFVIPPKKQNNYQQKPQKRNSQFISHPLLKVQTNIKTKKLQSLKFENKIQHENIQKQDQQMDQESEQQNKQSFYYQSQLISYLQNSPQQQQSIHIEIPQNNKQNTKNQQQQHQQIELKNLLALALHKEQKLVLQKKQLLFDQKNKQFETLNQQQLENLIIQNLMPKNNQQIKINYRGEPYTIQLYILNDDIFSLEGQQYFIIFQNNSSEQSQKKQQKLQKNQQIIKKKYMKILQNSTSFLNNSNLQLKYTLKSLYYFSFNYKQRQNFFINKIDLTQLIHDNILSFQNEFPQKIEFQNTDNLEIIQNREMENQQKHQRKISLQNKNSTEIFKSDDLLSKKLDIQKKAKNMPSLPESLNKRKQSCNDSRQTFISNLNSINLSKNITLSPKRIIKSCQKINFLIQFEFYINADQVINSIKQKTEEFEQISYENQIDKYRFSTQNQKDSIINHNSPPKTQVEKHSPKIHLQVINTHDDDNNTLNNKMNLERVISSNTSQNFSPTLNFSIVQSSSHLKSEYIQENQTNQASQNKNHRPKIKNQKHQSQTPTPYKNQDNFFHNNTQKVNKNKEFFIDSTEENFNFDENINHESVHLENLVNNLPQISNINQNNLKIKHQQKKIQNQNQLNLKLDQQNQIKNINNSSVFFNSF